MGTKKKKTHAEFITIMKKFQPTIDVLGKYLGNSLHISVRCKICGHQWMSLPGNLTTGFSINKFTGRGCPKCGRDKERRAKWFEENNLVDEYQVPTRIKVKEEEEVNKPEEEVKPFEIKGQLETNVIQMKDIKIEEEKKGNDEMEFRGVNFRDNDTSTYDDREDKRDAGTPRPHQVFTDSVLDLKVTELLRDVDVEGTSLSKGDVILVLTIFEDGIKEFYKEYKEYVKQSKFRNWLFCDKPHWFLKRLIDDKK